MTAKKYLLPTLEQCYSLTDEQCRLIISIRDPKGIRAHRNWELAHQPELIRQYMTMRSFTQIAQIMKEKVNLDWSYKTFANRYRDWLFPIDRVERELAIMDLHSHVTGGRYSRNSEYIFPQLGSSLEAQPSQSQSYQKPQGSYYLQPKQPDSFSAHEKFPSGYFGQDNVNDCFYDGISKSLLEFNSWSQDFLLDGTKSSNMSSVTPTYSIDQMSQNLVQPRLMDLQRRKKTNGHLRSDLRYQKMNFPNHDCKRGLWNTALRVIPCQRDHSRYSWESSFKPCTGCGFSQCHALMIQARNIAIETFREALSLLRNCAKPDFAGNHPIAFLMVAGVGIEYFRSVLWDIQWSTFEQNSFFQSPLHVLNTQNLGHDLVDLLKLFPEHLSLRDSKCRTLLHYLFAQPLEWGSYLQVLQIFPNATHYLKTYDTSGKLITQRMQEAGVRASSRISQDKIFAGLDEIKKFLSSSSNEFSNVRPYGFLEIARGANGNTDISSRFGPQTVFKCPICWAVNAHSNSHYDQMLCACEHGGIDRNAPDEEGWTAAHLLVTHTRFRNDSFIRPETPTETAELFRLLIFSPELREALHVLDPNGNSLVYNIATRGHSEILGYALELEEEERRCSTVNSFGRTKSGEKRSVLEGVEMAIIECDWVLKTRYRLNDEVQKKRLIELCNGLKNCRTILKKWGAEIRPCVKKQWKIC